MIIERSPRSTSISRRTMATTSTLDALVAELQVTKELPRAALYPGVKDYHVNQYIAGHGPIRNRVHGRIGAVFLDDGRFTPYRDALAGRSEVTMCIGTKLPQWCAWHRIGGSVTWSPGEFKLAHDVTVMPDVAYVTRDRWRSLTHEQIWTRDGAPFCPAIVVEVDTLQGPESRLADLDWKMRDVYFRYGVELGWLVDPNNRVVYQYKRAEDGSVECSVDASWRDMDFAPVIEGLTVQSIDLDMALEHFDDADGDEEGLEMECPVVDCTQIFSSEGLCLLHVAEHRQRAKLEKRRRQGTA